MWLICTAHTSVVRSRTASPARCMCVAQSWLPVSFGLTLGLQACPKVHSLMAGLVGLREVAGVPGGRGHWGHLSASEEVGIRGRHLSHQLCRDGGLGVGLRQARAEPSVACSAEWGGRLLAGGMQQAEGDVRQVSVRGSAGWRDAAGRWRLAAAVCYGAHQWRAAVRGCCAACVLSARHSFLQGLPGILRSKLGSPRRAVCMLCIVAAILH